MNDQIHIRKRTFMKMKILSVAAALRRGGSQGHIGRRSEIGSHATPKTPLFIPRGEPKSSWATLI